MMYANKEKAIRMNWLRAMILSAETQGRALDEGSIIADMEMRFSSSRRTILGYLKTFEGIKLIIRENGKIYPSKHYDTIKALDEIEVTK